MIQSSQNLRAKGDLNIQFLRKKKMYPILFLSEDNMKYYKMLRNKSTLDSAKATCNGKKIFKGKVTEGGGGGRGIKIADPLVYYSNG